MTEQLLDDTQRNAGGQLRGKPVTKAMGSHAEIKTSDLAVDLDQALDLANRQPAVPAVLKKRAVR